MFGLRGRRMSRSTRVMAAVWTLLFLLVTAWVAHAAHNWKVPVRKARHYWASRLTGRPQAFLGSDERWHYFALKGLFLHGWILGRVSHEAAAQARDETVRAHIDGLLDAHLEDRSLERAAELTGLSFATGDEWNEWWRAQRETYVWPAEQEQRWEQAVRSRWVRSEGGEEEIATREYYIAEIAGTWRKAAMEMLFFGGPLLLLWPVWPRLVAAGLRGRTGWRRLGTAAPLMLGVAFLTYVLIVVPYVCLDYGLGAATTLSGPGWLIFSGPHPFHPEYKPGNTILYRQFLELVWDPAVRLVDVGVLRWAGMMPLFVVGLLPYLAGAMALGGVLCLRRSRPEEQPPESLSEGDAPLTSARQLDPPAAAG